MHAKIWTFGFHKRLGSSLLAERLLASEENVGERGRKWVGSWDSKVAVFYGQVLPKYNKVRLLHWAHEATQYWRACVEKKRLSTSNFGTQTLLELQDNGLQMVCMYIINFSSSFVSNTDG
jgi:hypothetical protein